MNITPEQIAKNHSAVMDSVNLLKAGNVSIPPAPILSDSDWADTVKRNIEHINVMLAETYWTTENLQPLKDAVL